MVCTLGGIKARIVRAIRSSGNRSRSPEAEEGWYLDKLVGPTGVWDELAEYQRNFHIGAGLKPHHSLLDIGCGPLQGGIPLVSFLDKQRYVGLDICPERLAVAYRRIGEHGLAEKNPLLIHSETLGRDELDGRKFDFIWTSQLLYHLDAMQLDQLLERVSYHGNGTTFFHGDILIDDPAHTWLKSDSRWSVYRYHFHSVNEIAGLASQHGLRVEEIGPLEKYGYPKRVSLRTNRMLRITRNPRSHDERIAAHQLRG